MNRQKRKFYTLVELLVTISIIGILATILVSSMNKASVRSKQLGCKDNLKNMSVCLADFMSDNQMKYPAPEYSRNDSTGVSYDDHLGAYDGRNLAVNHKEALYLYKSAGYDNSMYRCPGESERNITSWKKDLGERSYSMSRYLTDQPTWSTEAAGIVVGQRATKIRRPEDCLVFIESSGKKGQNVMGDVGSSMITGQEYYTAYMGEGGYSGGNTAILPSMVHEGPVNALMADARAVTYQDFNPFLEKDDGTLASQGGDWTNVGNTPGWRNKNQNTTLWDPYKD